MRLTGAEIIVECLKEQRADAVFGYPGAAVLEIYDALYKNKQYVTHYLTAHEQGAAHAADGYARATGRTGVCMATSGPGATNLVTGIAAAYMDSIPLVVVTGNVGTQLLGKDSFQEVDIAGVTMPITKHGFIVKEAGKVADTARRAFNMAASGRPGPVLIDITKDAAECLADYTYKPPDAVRFGAIDPDSLSAAARLTDGAERPLILAGGGVISAGASGELYEFAQLIDAPVCMSMMGLGAYPASDRRCAGMAGVYGGAASKAAMDDCDLLIAAGARFSERVTGYAKRFAPKAKILHLDIDPAEINKNVLADAYITGDLKASLNGLLGLVKPAKHTEWIGRIAAVRVKKPFRYKKDGTLRPEYILTRLSEIAGGAIFTTDVGLHQLLACQFIPREAPRTFIASGGLGAMGFGLGAAIGAQIGIPEKRVVNVTGDGGFLMNAPELATAARYNIPVVNVVMNNGCLGMVRRLQDDCCGGRRFATDMPENVDFVKMAEGLGAVAMRLTDARDTDVILQKTLDCGKPAVVDCVVNYG